jgi:TolA-binding protein
MTNIHTEQLLRVLLSQAHAGREAERDQRLRAEQRATQARVLQFEMAQRLIPKELDDLWKSTDVNLMPDDQFMRWMISQLHAQLFEYRALRSGRVADQLAQLQTAVRERDARLKQSETQIGELQQQLREMAVLKEHGEQLQEELEQATQEKEELVTDLETSRAMVAQLRAQLAAADSLRDTPHANGLSVGESEVGATLVAASSEANSASTSILSVPVMAPVAPMTPTFDLVTFPAPSEQSPEWYAEWLATTRPEDRDRQSAAIYAIGQGHTFLRAEVMEYLNAIGLAGESDPDKPSGLAGRVFRGLIENGLVEEVDGGFGSAVPALLRLSEKGRTAYTLWFGEPLEETLYDRLLKRHKTPEHTVLNVLARRTLKRFGFSQIDLFPDPVRLASGLLAEPDLVAISPNGEKLYLECERGHLVRTDEERAAKWNRMVELGHGRLYLFVPNKTARGNLLAEMSAWITSQRAAVRRAELSFCEYTKALTAPNVWTYSTSIYQ